ncbi:hypothetical protein ACGFX4_19830 [Kitasatospora sp. NPDC048365]|uniref:hypothetical protein n=1 Tax=Kitasatospora sp. NPDC048365 TaxID=3364050 RepID=UPI00371FB637
MILGVAVALLANVLYSAGFVLEKHALASLPPLDPRRPVRLILALSSSPRWLLGFTLLALGFGAQLKVYQLLPIAAAQGIFVTGTVLLVALSAVTLGERPGRPELLGTGVIVIALLLVVGSLGDDDQVGGAAPLVPLLGLCLPCLAFGLVLFLASLRQAGRRHRRSSSGVSYGVALGLLYGVSSLAIKGTSAAFTALPVGAALLEVARGPYPWLLGATGTAGLALSQTALQRCRASVIVPVTTTVSCVFTVVAGTAVFGEHLPAEPVRLALRLGGTALTVLVLAALPRHDNPPVPTTTGRSTRTGRRKEKPTRVPLR